MTGANSDERGRIRIKICGIRRPRWAEAAADAGADYIGLVFAKSPRQVTIEEAKEVLSAVPPEVTAVGLFVNAEPDEIRRVAEGLDLKAVQLHGAEVPQTVAALSDFVVIKAFRLGSQEDVAEAGEYLRSCEAAGRRPDICLADARVAGGPVGGTGQRIPPDVAADAREVLWPLLLAGGLGPESVGEAICAVRPWGVDVSSGVESSPGVKDPERIKAFIEAVRAAENKVQRHKGTERQR